MLIQKALLGLPVSFFFFTPIGANDVYEPSPPDELSRRIIPLAVRKMGLDEGEKFYPEQYYGFQSEDYRINVAPDSIRKGKSDNFGRSLVSLFSFGRRSPSTATSPDSRHRRQDQQEGGRWPAAARSTQDKDSPPTNATKLISAERLFPPAYLPPFSIHQEASDSSERHDTGGDIESLELFRRAADALARLNRRQWGCPTGTTSCESIGYPYSCCSETEKCYKVTDTGLGPVGCCPEGEECGGAVSDCTSGSTACPESLGGGCCIAGYVCKGVGCVKKSTSSTTTATKTSTTTSTTLISTGQPTTIVVTVVVTETPNGTPTTRTTTITSTHSAKTTSTSSEGGVAPVKPTLTASDSGLPAGYCPTGYYACLASAGGGCCQTGRDCLTTSCPPTAAMTTILNTNGITVVVPETAAAAATATSATCASGWFLCGANSGPVAGCCPSGYSCGTASCLRTGASATTVQKEPATSSGHNGSTSSGSRAKAGWSLLAVAAPLLLMHGF